MSARVLAALLLFASSAAAATRPVTLDLDAREMPRKRLSARLTIPAAPGPLTLLYPKWIPGHHGPYGPIADLTGLRFTAGGKPIPWRRDPLEMFAFHVDVPAGADAVEVDLDYFSPPETSGDSIESTAKLAVLRWTNVILYPKGAAQEELMYAASVRVPAGWKLGTSLPVAKTTGDRVEFQPQTLEMLADAPVLTGLHFVTVPLAQDPLVQMFVAADSEAALEFGPELRAAYQRLVAETNALFGARHYRTYSFLVTLSDHARSFSLEHHESSENRLVERAFIDQAPRVVRAGLLPHEYVHSWNGKYRRPAGESVGFEGPATTELAWVYEGLTSYLGDVLTARSGLRTLDETRAALASMAGDMDAQRGRTWRPLVDTAVAASVVGRSRGDGAAWRRGYDFYPESVLLWLEADVVIRKETKGRKSLDDFCRAFFGGESGPPRVVPYSHDDVIRGLEAVASYDWRGFWKARLESPSDRAPLGGVTGSGWKVVYKEDVPEFLRWREQTAKNVDLRHSIGLILGEDGTIADVIPGLAADKAGAGASMKVVAVNGRRWSPALMRRAIRDAKSDRPMELLLESGEFFQTVRLDYTGGDRYPVLERDPSQPDLLEAILKPALKAPTKTTGK